VCTEKIETKVFFVLSHQILTKRYYKNILVSFSGHTVQFIYINNMFMCINLCTRSGACWYWMCIYWTCQSRSVTDFHEVLMETDVYVSFFSAYYTRINCSRLLCCIMRPNKQYCFSCLLIHQNSNPTVHVHVCTVSLICKHAMNTEVVDCRGQTSPRRSNSAPFLHLLQQHNPVQPTENRHN